MRDDVMKRWGWSKNLHIEGEALDISNFGSVDASSNLLSRKLENFSLVKMAFQKEKSCKTHVWRSLNDKQNIINVFITGQWNPQGLRTPLPKVNI